MQISEDTDLGELWAGLMIGTETESAQKIFFWKEFSGSKDLLSKGRTEELFDL